MDNEKNVTYAIIAACVVGIIIVGFFVIINTSSKESFSELYFEDHTELPMEAAVWDAQDFTFTVVSHEQNLTSYTYNVLFGENVIEEGSFVLDPGSNISINISFIPQISSLVFEDNITTLESSHFTINKPTAIPIPSLISDANSDVSVALDPDVSESYTYTYTAREPFSSLFISFDDINDDGFRPNYFNIRDISDAQISISNQENLTFLPVDGIDLVFSKITVLNERGDVTITHKKTVSEYRHEFRKVSVEVVSDAGTEYEIHFWLIVKEKDVTKI
jgi:hypothetical protein